MRILRLRHQSQIFHSQQFDLIHDRIKLNRATAFSLMGAGLSGAKGVNKIITCHIVNIYVVPTLINGLESQNIIKSQMNELEKYYGFTLRQLHSLPQHVAKEAVYLLVGALLLWPILHMQTLNLLQKMAKCSLLYQVDLR